MWQEALVEAETASSEDFLWQMRLRYYWNESLVSALCLSTRRIGRERAQASAVLTERCGVGRGPTGTAS